MKRSLVSGLVLLLSIAAPEQVLAMRGERAAEGVTTFDAEDPRFKDLYLLQDGAEALQNAGSGDTGKHAAILDAWGKLRATTASSLGEPGSCGSSASALAAPPLLK